jgi:hypothetical protein
VITCGLQHDNVQNINGQLMMEKGFAKRQPFTAKDQSPLLSSGHFTSLGI